MRGRLPWLVLALVLAVALAIGAQGRSGPRTEAQRVTHIASEIRCPTCRNQSAAESDAAAAKAVRDEIQRRVRAGESDGEIVSFLVSRYGSDILLKPGSSGVASLVWALPVVAVVVALAGLAVAFRRWRARPGVSVSEEDRALVERELEKSEQLEMTEQLTAVDLDALADLEEQRRFLVQSLKDLEREREAGDIDEVDYRTLKDDYTARTAAVLHAIDERRVGLAQQQRGARRKRSTKWTALIVAGVVALAIGGGVLVAATSGERVPGQTATGNVPSNVSDQLTAAQQDLAEGKAVDALKLYDQVLKQDPRNAQALTFRGWILESANLHDEALASLDKAIAADPNFPMAHYFKGAVLFQGKNDPAGAVKEFQAFLASNPPPDAAKTAQDALDQARAAAGQSAR